MGCLALTRFEARGEERVTIPVDVDTEELLGGFGETIGETRDDRHVA